MTENYQLETARANIVTVVTKMPKGVCLADFQQAYLETVGSHLNPIMLGFENVESLLKVLTEDVIQLDYDVDDIVISLKADKSSRASIPTQEVPDDNLVLVVVGEIFYPTKLYIQLASQY